MQQAAIVSTKACHNARRNQKKRNHKTNDQKEEQKSEGLTVLAK